MYFFPLLKKGMNQYLIFVHPLQFLWIKHPAHFNSFLALTGFTSASAGRFKETIRKERGGIQKAELEPKATSVMKLASSGLCEFLNKESSDFIMFQELIKDSYSLYFIRFQYIPSYLTSNSMYSSCVLKDSPDFFWMTSRDVWTGHNSPRPKHRTCTLNSKIQQEQQHEKH